MASSTLRVLQLTVDGYDRNQAHPLNSPLNRCTLISEVCRPPLQQFARFLRYAVPYRARIALSIACLFLIALLNAVSVGSLQPVFDGLFASEGGGSGISLPAPIKALLGERLVQLQTFLQAHRISVLTFIGAALFLVFLAKGVLTYLQQLQMRYVSEGSSGTSGTTSMRTSKPCPLSFFTRRSTGEIMSRLSSDVETLGDASTELFRNALREPLNIVGLIVLLFMIKWQLALLSLVVLPVAILPIVKFGSKIRRRGTRVQEWRAELNTILQETISGIRIVKAFGMEEYEKRRFREASDQVFRGHHADRGGWMRLTSPVLEVLGCHRDRHRLLGRRLPGHHPRASPPGPSWPSSGRWPRCINP